VRSRRRLRTGSGRLPDDLRAELLKEEPLLLEEGLAGSLTLRHFRAPRERASWEKRGISGAIVVTPHRLLVWAGGGKNIDIPLAHPLRSSIKVVAEKSDRVCFAYDLGTFNHDRSGQVEVRFRTRHAARIVELL
jgi:hypothetical protein